LLKFGTEFERVSRYTTRVQGHRIRGQGHSVMYGSSRKKHCRIEMNRLTYFKLGMDVAVKMGNEWHNIGQPQFAKPCNCHIFKFQVQNFIVRAVKFRKGACEE